jgi:hypothetical protein
VVVIMAKQKAVPAGKQRVIVDDRHLPEVEREVPGPVPRPGPEAELERVQDPRRSSKVEGDPRSEIGRSGSLPARRHGRAPVS